MALSSCGDSEAVTCPSATLCWILEAVVKVEKSCFVRDSPMTRIEKTRIPGFQKTCCVVILINTVTE